MTRKSNVTNPAQIHNIAKEHFNSHFYYQDIPKLEPFAGNPAKLKKTISLKQVKQAVTKLNKDEGPDGISRIN